MKKPRPLSGGEKWIVALTVVFAVSMVGLYALSCRDNGGERGSYSVSTEGEGELSSAVESARWQVNINTASAEELTVLSGVGDVIAERIVAYRDAHGAFTALEELLEVEGIGESKLEAMREQIILEDEE